jgi:FkbM family methyltransferase
MSLGALFFPNTVPFDSLYIPYIYKEIYLEGVYIDILNQKKDMVIIDVGGNIGIVTNYMRPHAKKIYTIEPSAEHFEALAKNKEFNNWDNVEIFKMAISDKNGEMKLNYCPNNRTSHSLTLNYGGDGEMVKTMTLKSFLEENKIEKVDFMKFDVEGAEDSILLNPEFDEIANKFDAIEVEFHFPSYPTIIEHMMKLGFKARRYEASAVIVLFFR